MRNRNTNQNPAPQANKHPFHPEEEVRDRPYDLPDQTILSDSSVVDTKRLALLLGCSVSHLEVCRSRGRGIPFIRLPGGAIRYRVKTVREYLDGLQEHRGTHEFATHAVAGPGRPRRTRHTEGER